MADRNDGPLSATYINPLRERLLVYARERREFLMKQFYASGYPPNTRPSSPFETYQRLVQLQQSGNPLFWQSQEAQDELRKLEQQFGPAPALTPQPIGGPQVQPPMAPTGGM